MKLWKLESFERHTTPSGAPMYIADHRGESRAALYKRAKVALGISGRQYQAHSDHSAIFYIGRRGMPALARAELVELEEPGGNDWRLWLRDKLGTPRWCVTPRMTARLEREGYTVAVTQRRFNDLKAEYLTERGIPK